MGRRAASSPRRSGRERHLRAGPRLKRFSTASFADRGSGNFPIVTKRRNSDPARAGDQKGCALARQGGGTEEFIEIGAVPVCWRGPAVRSSLPCLPCLPCLLGSARTSRLSKGDPHGQIEGRESAAVGGTMMSSRLSAAAAPAPVSTGAAPRPLPQLAPGSIPSAASQSSPPPLSSANRKQPQTFNLRADARPALGPPAFGLHIFRFGKAPDQQCLDSAPTPDRGCSSAESRNHRYDRTRWPAPMQSTLRPG